MVSDVEGERVELHLGIRLNTVEFESQGPVVTAPPATACTPSEVGVVFAGDDGNRFAANTNDAFIDLRSGNFELIQLSDDTPFPKNTKLRTKEI